MFQKIESIAYSLEILALVFKAERRLATQGKMMKFKTGEEV
jgi:hypothetical protein